MQTRIRLREWEEQNFRRLYLLKYKLEKFGNQFTKCFYRQTNFVAFIFWQLTKVIFAIAWAFFVGPRIVRHIEPGKVPQSSYEFDHLNGGGLWK